MELKYKIEPLPSAAKRAHAVVIAADLLFNDELGIDGYMPSFLCFARKYGVLACFTDLELSQDLEELWAFVNNTTVYRDVAKEVGNSKVSEFLFELNELIQARKDARIHMINVDRILNKIIGLVGGLNKQLIKKVDISKILTAIEGLSKGKGGEDLLKKIIAAYGGKK